MDRSAALVTILLLFTACRPAPPPTPAAVPRATPSPVASGSPGADATPGPLRIGAIFNLGTDGGPGARAQWESATLAVELVNARGGVRMQDGHRRRLELLVYDDDGISERTALAMRSLVFDDGALAIVGPAEREPARVAILAAERADVPLITLGEPPAGESNLAPHWTFSLALDDEQALTTLAKFLAAGGPRRLGWIAPRTARAAAVRTALIQFTARTDRPSLIDESYALSDTDLGDMMARLADAGAEQIIGWPRGAEDAAALARAAAERAPRSRLYLGPGATSDGFFTLAGPAAADVRVVTIRLLVTDDLWDFDPLTPAVRDFSRAFRLRYGTAPSPPGALVWDAIRIAVEALERSVPERRALRDAIEATEAYTGATGQISFGARHDGLDRGAFLVARAGPNGWRIPP